jgi:putative FmdB family regulatory protein
MPTYDYVCDACSHEFELFQAITAPVQRKCPKCRKLKLRRLFGTGAAVMFKGSGFYQTDYRSESYKKAAAAETKPAESKGDGGADGGSGKSAAGGAKSETPVPSKPKKKKKDV